MYTDAQFDFMVRFVTNYEVLFYSLDQMKRHACYFSSVVVSISDWKTRYHHVSVTYCLYLQKLDIFKTHSC